MQMYFLNTCYKLCIGMLVCSDFSVYDDRVIFSEMAAQLYMSYMALQCIMRPSIQLFPVPTPALLVS